jgi:glutamine synthetase
MNGLKVIYKNKKFLLEKSLEFFVEATGLIPKVGVELEFYLTNQDGLRPVNQGLVDEYISDLQKNISKKSLIYKIEKEQGVSQIEVKMMFNADLIRVCDDVENIKLLAKNLAQQTHLIATFAAQPFSDDCGSALQFNISLHNQDQNLFAKKEAILFAAIAGILDSIDSMMVFCAPNEADYLRFDRKINLQLYKQGKYTAPVNISFGENNRTAAIRIPHVEKLANTRLEFRVASANSDPYLVLSAILIAMEYGIKNQHERPQMLYGNAFDEQYNLPEFVKNLDDARKCFFAKGNLVREKLEEFLLHAKAT